MRICPFWNSGIRAAVPTGSGPSLPGSRVLDGNWGAEHMAIAVPKGREAAQGLLDSFVRDVQSSGRLQQIETVAGLKGAVSAEKD